MPIRIGLVLKKGCDVPRSLQEALERYLKKGLIEIASDLNDQDLQAILVLGGDGTFLRTAPLAYQRDIPLLGINLGRLGFLTEITKQEVDQILEALSTGQYEIEKRLLLEISYGGEIFYALNEAAIIKGPLGHMIHLRVFREDKEITIYHGDGLIIATPTGSTAYNLSAGGPIVYPTSEVIILTPICPFMLSARPIVLPAKQSLYVELLSQSEEVHLIIDGYINKTLQTGEHVILKRAPRFLKVVRSPVRDYFAILRTKLGWTASTN